MDKLMDNKKSFDNTGFLLRSNKKGKLLTIYWYFVITIVTIAIVSMVLVFYGAKYDTRPLEAKILGDKIANCVAQGGLIKESVFSSDFKINFLKECGINFDDESEEYYVSVTFYDYNSCHDMQCDSFMTESLGKVESQNGQQLLTYCDVGNEKNGKFPFCMDRSFYAVAKIPNTNVEKKVIVKIKIVVNKIKENV